MTIESTPTPPNILLIDSYDSFTFNLARLVRQAIPDAAIYIVQNDSIPFDVLKCSISAFSAIIVGPGPGSPSVPQDIGIINDIWRENLHIPIFGVCLGLQSLALAFGGEVTRLASVKHGITSQIRHSQQGVFQGIGSIVGVRYHSLHVKLNRKSVLTPLAWADDPDNGEVIMGLMHSRLPFYAVQYHPESVSTEGGGVEVLANFWRLAQRWNVRSGRACPLQHAPAPPSFGSPWPPYKHRKSKPISMNADKLSVITSTIDNIHLSPVMLAELLGADKPHSPFVFLDSASEPGRFAIIGATNRDSLRIQYVVGDTSVRTARGSCIQEHCLEHTDIWQWCQRFMHEIGSYRGHPESPFWGGLVGYISYEAGLSSLSIGPPTTSPHPDINLIFVERSLVFDTKNARVYIQGLRCSDKPWVDEVKSKILAAIATHNNHIRSPSPPSHATRPDSFPRPSISFPDKEKYLSSIRSIQDHLSCGDSYEICLTCQTTIETFTPLSSWQLYKRLRSKNPAPHSSYLRLGPTTILSSSPERFLSFSRPPNTLCQLRPIKGTLRNSPDVTLSDAFRQLKGSPKEVAENRMIVDLILHDLRSVLGTDVSASKFCEVEEYKTVYQLVSVIEGQSHCPADDRTVGWNVLQRSLPPGSMTGAPKKRSVEILQKLEDGNPRGVYSGVVGYWCVSGAGDWSVTIRTATSFNPEGEVQDSCIKPQKWTIGAGGAITALSDPEAEWDEMKLKLESALQAFS